MYLNVSSIRSWPPKLLFLANLIAMACPAGSQTPEGDGGVIFNLNTFSLRFDPTQEIQGSFDLWAAMSKYAPLLAVLPATGSLPEMEITCNVVDHSFKIVIDVELGVGLKFECKEAAGTFNQNSSRVTLWHRYGQETVCVKKQSDSRLEDKGCHAVTAKWYVPPGPKWTGLDTSALDDGILSFIGGISDIQRGGVINTEIYGRDSGLAGLSINLANFAIRSK